MYDILENELLNKPSLSKYEKGILTKIRYARTLEGKTFTLLYKNNHLPPERYPEKTYEDINKLVNLSIHQVRKFFEGRLIIEKTNELYWIEK